MSSSERKKTYSNFLSENYTTFHYNVQNPKRVVLARGIHKSSNVIWYGWLTIWANWASSYEQGQARCYYYDYYYLLVMALPIKYMSRYARKSLDKKQVWVNLS